MRFGKLIAATALSCALVLPANAAPRDRADGWHAWTERAERIFVAIQSGESPRLDSACKGVTGTVIGQGFAFPRWAQALIQVCTVTQAAYHGSNNNRRSKQICKDLASVSKQIGKATEVPEDPRARDVAIRLSRIMIEMRDQMCVNFR